MQSSEPVSATRTNRTGKISERVRIYRLEHRSKSRKTLLGSLRELYYQAKYRAQRKGIRCEIDYDYLVDLYNAQNGQCAMSGAEMTYEKRTRHSVWENWANMSLDRIDSSLGYIPGNVHLVCVSINVMKNDLPMPLFVNLCRKIVDMADSAGPEHVLNMTPNETLFEELEWREEDGCGNNDANSTHKLIDFIEDSGDYSRTEMLAGLWKTRAERRSTPRLEVTEELAELAETAEPTVVSRWSVRLGGAMEASDTAASSSSADQSDQLSNASPKENMQVY